MIQGKHHSGKIEPPEGRLYAEPPVAMSLAEFRTLTEQKICASEPFDTLILLESQLQTHPASRYSIFAFDPDLTISARGETIELDSPDGVRNWQANPWDALKSVRQQYPGWYLGYLGYDLKNHLEHLSSLNRDDVKAPDLLFFRPGVLWVFDHQAGLLHKWVPSPESEAPDKASGKPSGRRPVPGGEESDVQSGVGGNVQGRVQAVSGCSPFRLGQLAAETSPVDYIGRIRRAQELIKEGDVYEINLSHLLRAPYSGHSYDLYSRMRSAGPVPFASYLQHRRWSVCSSSPERFLRRDGDTVFSQPIKGTAPRMDDPAADKRVRRELRASEKERAENLMIVDLVRHDLSRVCKPGSIQVPDLFALQSFETVHQLISTVEGRLPDHADPIDVVQACFPMGSMTGAPKIRAMEIIDQLESYRRGVYSGSIGYITPDGDFDLNVVIRTAIMDGKTLSYPVGGAITSDSVPEKELEETWIKARALRNAVEPEKEPV